MIYNLRYLVFWGLHDCAKAENVSSVLEVLAEVIHEFEPLLEHYKSLVVLIEYAEGQGSVIRKAHGQRLEYHRFEFEGFS